MLLPNQALGAPFVSQELEEKNQDFVEEELEASHAENGGKRALSDYLKDHCPPYKGTGYSSRGCVKALYSCRGFVEAVCARLTFESSSACNINIGLYGFPKCFPNYKWVGIKSSQGPKKVRWTKSCSCTRTQ